MTTFDTCVARLDETDDFMSDMLKCISDEQDAVSGFRIMLKLYFIYQQMS